MLDLIKHHAGDEYLEKMYRYFQSQTMCDFTIEVQNRRIRAHRLVLSAASEYFEAMLTNITKASSEGKVTLTFFNARAVEDVVNYFYTGELDIREDNVRELTILGKHFKLAAVQDSCYRIFKKLIRPSNCLSIENFARTNCLPKLLHSAQYCIIESFEEVSRMNEFLSLPSQRILDLLRSDIVSTLTQKELVDGAVRWVNHDHASRNLCLGSFLNCISLQLTRKQSSNVVSLSTLGDSCTSQSALRSALCRWISDGACPERNENAKVLYKEVVDLWENVRLLWPTTALLTVADHYEDFLVFDSRERGFHTLCELLDALADYVKKYKDPKINFVPQNQTQLIDMLRKGIRGVTITSLEKAVDCISNWIACTKPMLGCREFLLDVLNCRNDEMFEPATIEFVEKSLHDNNLKYDPKNYIEIALSFRPMLQPTVQKKDNRFLTKITMLICDFAQSQQSYIARSLHDEKTIELLNFLVELCTIPLDFPCEETSSPICVFFWQEQLREPSPNITEGNFNQILILYKRFFASLLGKIRYPKDELYNTWLEVDKSSLKNYRNDVEKVLSLLCKQLNRENVVLILNDMFQTSMPALDRNPSTAWHEMESCMFGINVLILTMDINVDILHPRVTKMLSAFSVKSSELGETLFHAVACAAPMLARDPQNFLKFIRVAIKHVNDFGAAIVQAAYATRELLKVGGETVNQCSEDLLKLITDALLARRASGKLLEINYAEAEGHMMQAIAYLLDALSDKDLPALLMKFIDEPTRRLEILMEPSFTGQRSTLLTDRIEIAFLTKLVVQTVFSLSQIRMKSNRHLVHELVLGNTDCFKAFERFQMMLKEVLNRWLTALDQQKTSTL